LPLWGNEQGVFAAATNLLHLWCISLSKVPPEGLKVCSKKNKIKENPRGVQLNKDMFSI
jgi:hypothetical protein